MPRLTKAFLCEHKCGHNAVLRKKRMVAHEHKCAMNTQRRACKTCDHNRRDKANGVWCDINALPDGVNLMFDCPLWRNHENI